MEGKKVCSYKIIPPKTNLNKITIHTNFGERKKNVYPGDKELLLKRGNDPNERVEVIGKGANGEIYLISWGGKKPASIVFKYPTTDPEFEVNAAKNILGDYHHFVIPYRIIYDQYENPFIIMQEANGDVDSLLTQNKLTKRFKNQMIFHYVEAIGKLWNHSKIVFSDMKTQNLLYQCHDDGINFYFGDIGAFSKNGMREYDYEVEPPECKGEIDKNFCLFTIGLLIISIYEFEYDRPMKDGQGFEDLFYIPIKDQIDLHIGNPILKRMAKKLLALDPTFRNENSVNTVVNLILGK